MLWSIASSSRRSTTSLCRQCLLRQSRLASVVVTPIRNPVRGYNSLSGRRDGDKPGFPSYPRPVPFSPKPPKPTLSPESFLPPPPPTANYIVKLLLHRLPEFLRSERFRGKLEDYGLTPQVQTRLIREFDEKFGNALDEVETEQQAKVVLAQGGWDEEKLKRTFGGDGVGFASTAESMFYRKFVEFASTHPTVGSSLQLHLQHLLEVTDLSRLAFKGDFTRARSMTRHFHLHLGPTNSGKTYNALKALAQAKTGAYAGPLRLLAHEVWERLNLGTVGGLDGEKKQCNLLTGEERRIVDPDAGLQSCTVEMLPLAGPVGGYDVVVIDEIQMMGDAQRGGAWTNAVLGVCAKEVHLCGDETTLELLKELIPALGDELTIHQYKRLTPLHVAEESLNGDWNKVEKGDCIVTFSRNNIFAIKKQIESTAAKKCAVVYGALPPETRADQARDFNDENGRCEILVASDAVGMGLNLKIKRIIFESLEKFNGKEQVPLALTQVKQIAGRAGRFGMHTKKPATTAFDALEDPVEPEPEQNLGGVVTTLHKQDLPILREVLPLELPKIQLATLDVPYKTRADVALLLPPNTPYVDVLDHLNSLIQIPSNMRTSAFQDVVPLAEMLEPYRNTLTFHELHVFTSCPVNRRDPMIISVFNNIIRQYSREGLVEIDKAFFDTRFLSLLDLVEGTLAVLPPLPPIIGIGRRVLTPPIIVSSLPQMESMHKALVMYIWLSFRLEVAFPERARANNLKLRVETVLDQCLARFPGLRNLKSHERTKAGDRAVADWRKQYVAPNGTLKIPGSTQKGVLWVEEAVIQRLKNKQIWQSTGVVPFGKVLAEADGKGPLRQVEMAYSDREMMEARKLLHDPNEPDPALARQRLYAIAAPEGDPVDMYEVDMESGEGQRVESLPHEKVKEDGYTEEDLYDEEGEEPGHEQERYRGYTQVEDVKRNAVGYGVEGPTELFEDAPPKRRFVLDRARSQPNERPNDRYRSNGFQQSGPSQNGPRKSWGARNDEHLDNEDAGNSWASKFRSGNRGGENSFQRESGDFNRPRPGGYGNPRPRGNAEDRPRGGFGGNRPRGGFGMARRNDDQS